MPEFQPASNNPLSNLLKSTKTLVKDNCSAHPAGALGLLASGQSWISIGSNPPNYVQTGGAFCPAITYSSALVGGDEFFATTNAGAPILSAGGHFRIRNNAPTTTNGVAIIGLYAGDTNTVVVHLIITQYSWYMSYILGGSQIVVQPDNYFGAAPFAFLGAPLNADSKTRYSVYWGLDIANSRVYIKLPDGTTVTFTDPHFASLFNSTLPNRPFWEGQTPATTDAIFEWTDIWADSTPNFSTFGFQ